MEWYKKLMWGRYGVDQLTTALCILAFILTILGRSSDIGLFTVFGSVAIGFAVFRILSKNIPKRSSENQRFLVKWNPIYNRLRGKYYTLTGRKTHKYFKCPGCGQKLRVPKNKGNISIRCPKCSASFKAKT
ncbi:MAG: hypothetical protein AB9844_03355 [Clostridiaceae bacterium]